MTQLQALQMRVAINALIRLTDPDRYCVAIAERMPATNEYAADYELHMYLRNPTRAGIVQLTLLANAIKSLGTSYMVVDSTFDAGTKKGEDIRKSVKIW